MYRFYKYSINSNMNYICSDALGIPIPQQITSIPWKPDQSVVGINDSILNDAVPPTAVVSGKSAEDVELMSSESSSSSSSDE